MNIYFLLARFISSSLIAAVIDIAMFMVAYKMTASIAFSVFLPRYTIGPAVNFTMNRAIVFKFKGGWIQVAAEYALLATVLGVIASLGISWLTKDLKISMVFAKIIVESLLFPASFTIQRDYIFKRAGE
jgi:putative flippase GtrA